MPGRQCANCGKASLVRKDDIVLHKVKGKTIKLRMLCCAACHFVSLFLDDETEVSEAGEQVSSKSG